VVAVTAFLLDQRMASQLGVRGRYWMTRTLLEVGALYERQSRLDQAREAWALILKTSLPGAVLAEDRLARTGGGQWRSADGSRSDGAVLAPPAANNANPTDAAAASALPPAAAAPTDG